MIALASYNACTGNMRPLCRQILLALEAETHPDGEWCITFKGLAKASGLDLTTIRAEAPRLRKDGFAEYHRGLFNFEENRAAGSGYCITESGRIEAEKWRQAAKLADAIRHRTDEMDGNRRHTFTPTEEQKA